MGIPRIIIADNDINYITPIQLKFIEEFFDKINLEIITDHDYFDEYFSKPLDIDVLVISEDYYIESLKRHNIGQIFLMTEDNDESTGDLLLNRIYKYTSIKEIFNEIVGKSADLLNVDHEKKDEPQIILVYSASGGTGKTTLALGISSFLARNYKRVLYLNASYTHTFQRFFENQSPISSPAIYAGLIQNEENIYNEIKHVIRKEKFFYVPPFKTSLLSLDVSFSIYNRIASDAKKSKDYDFIVVDADPVLNEGTAELLNSASKVFIVTNQNESSVYATNILISNLNGVSSDKYCFICNNFMKDQKNALISSKVSPKFSVSEYIDHIENYDDMGVEEFQNNVGIQKVTFLII